MKIKDILVLFCYILILCSLLGFLATPVRADNVLVVHQNYAGVNTNVGNRLIAAGHTVTYTTSDPTNLSNYQQVWDLRYSVAVSGSLATVYDTFIKNSGFLYLTTENPGCCATRNNSVAAFISNAGGGSTTVGGTAGSVSNTLNVMNTTYMTPGTVVSFAAGSAIVNASGTWLFKDSAGKVGGMVWIGNAGDLGAAYNGTIMVVSDINWTDSTYFNAGNLVALDDLIDGVVLGTVQGTISESGNSGASAPTAVYSSGISIAQQARKASAQTLYPNGHAAVVDIQGSDNEVSIQQVGGKGHFVNVGVTGNINTIDILQTSSDSITKHYMEATIVGSSNNVTLQQRDASKTQFVNVNGNNNVITTNQKGTGNHYLDLSVTGNNHTAGIIQDGSGNHKATVQLSGSQPWNFTLNQAGSTDKTYSLPHSMSDGAPVSGTCSSSGGCSLIINQQ